LQDGLLRIDLPEAVRAPMEVVWIAYLRQAETAVARGENTGRRLKEFNIVRGSQVVGRWDGEARQLTVPLAQLPPDADAVAVLVQQLGQGGVLGAAALNLSRGAK
jgi:hypothetical protein